MGWKCSFIIIDSAKDFDEKVLLKNIGFNSIEKTDKVDFFSALNPKQDEIFIGRYKGKIVICENTLPSKMISKTPTSVEMLISEMYFPNSEVCSLVLHSVINLWGYSIVKNNTKIRARGGNIEDGLKIDYGKPIKEEEELFSKSVVNSEGKRMYYLDTQSQVPFNEEAMGESFVFKVASRYFKEELNRDNDIFSSQLQGYKKIDKLQLRVKEYHDKKRKRKVTIITIIAILIMLYFLKPFL